MFDRVVLKRRLDEAEDAYHQLMMGGVARVFVDQNGERIEYNTQSSRALSAYIDTLKTQLGLCSNGPMRVFM